MSEIKTIQQLLSAGRPASGYALTHDIKLRTLKDTLHRLPYGVLDQVDENAEPKVIRDYRWRRYSGSAQLAVGAVRGEFDAPAEVYPRIVVASLESFGPYDARKQEDRVLGLLGRLPYADLITMLLDRAWEIDGRVPVHPAYVCEGCEEPLSATLKAEPEHLSVGCVEWDPKQAPAGLVWLDKPFDYGQEQVTALVVTSITWANLYRDQPASAMQNRKWTTIRAVSESVTGYVTQSEEEGAKPVLRFVGIGKEDLEDRMCGRQDWDRAAAAVYGCSGGAMLVGRVKHRCGVETQVPFDWLGAASI